MNPIMTLANAKASSPKCDEGLDAMNANPPTANTPAIQNIKYDILRCGSRSETARMRSSRASSRSESVTCAIWFEKRWTKCGLYLSLVFQSGNGGGHTAAIRDVACTNRRCPRLHAPRGSCNGRQAHRTIRQSHRYCMPSTYWPKWSRAIRIDTESWSSGNTHQGRLSITSPIIRVD
ncbi:hypothetical protein FF011L_44550 [Roseimaritima multifibrata]|uniref:Uncharacterized protein n=1 Tax=Roseimaritima multifibrata TaxID=1930274 RepID=A0A517MLM2_9BACT|nr:hypothetical protein FF011L_44550 [Roseimaritima multifibrata]